MKRYENLFATRPAFVGFLGSLVIAKEPLELVVGRMGLTSWDDAGLDEVILYLKKSKYLSVPETWKPFL